MTRFEHSGLNVYFKRYTRAVKDPIQPLLFSCNFYFPLQRIMHQYPLHRISYCADDKGQKKFFSFIAKEEDAERHTCFVFVSDKLAEEITLTIGQAFDLAYKRFLETSGKDLETQKRVMLLQQKIKRLEHENNVYRQRLHDIASIKGSVLKR